MISVAYFFFHFQKHSLWPEFSVFFLIALETPANLPALLSRISSSFFFAKLNVFENLSIAYSNGICASKAKGFHVNLHQDLTIKYKYFLLKSLNVNRVFDGITFQNLACVLTRMPTRSEACGVPTIQVRTLNKSSLRMNKKALEKVIIQEPIHFCVAIIMVLSIVIEGMVIPWGEKVFT